MAKEEEAQKSFFLHHRQRHLSFTDSSIFNTNNSNNIRDNNNGSFINIDNYSNNYINNRNIYVVIIVMLVLLIIIVFIACKCKPWRFFVSSSFAPRSRTVVKDDDVRKPLISEDSGLVRSHSDDFARTVDVEGAAHQGEGDTNSPRIHGLAHKQNHLSTTHQLTHSTKALPLPLI